MVDGVLYMWIRNTANATLAWSTDRGQTWTWGLHFDGDRFGCPTFLNTGRNGAGTPTTTSTSIRRTARAPTRATTVWQLVARPQEPRPRPRRLRVLQPGDKVAGARNSPTAAQPSPTPATAPASTPSTLPRSAATCSPSPTAPAEAGVSSTRRTPGARGRRPSPPPTGARGDARLSAADEMDLKRRPPDGPGLLGREGERRLLRPGNGRGSVPVNAGQVMWRGV